LPLGSAGNFCPSTYSPAAMRLCCFTSAPVIGTSLPFVSFMSTPTD
jgi:hypothetical protein